MPSFCGLPCFQSKDKRHTEDQIVEKPVVVAVPNYSSTVATNPTQTSTYLNLLTPAEISQTSKVEPVTITTSDAKTTASDETPPVATTDESTDTADPTTIPPHQQEDMDSLKGATSGVTDTVSSGAQQASSGVQGAASTAQNTVTGGSSSEGTDKWNAMSEDQKKATYDALPAEKKDNLSYYEWISQGYQHKKENWMPWIEDMYLRWFTSDNKASYAAKDTLDKSKITGIEQVDNLQDGVNNLAASQVGQGGLLQPVGDAVSKEGVNRAERGGKDDSGSYAGAVGSSVSSAGGSVWSGAKSAGGYVGGMFGGKKQEPSK